MKKIEKTRPVAEVDASSIKGAAFRPAPGPGPGGDGEINATTFSSISLTNVSLQTTTVKTF